MKIDRHGHGRGRHAEDGLGTSSGAGSRWTFRVYDVMGRLHWEQALVERVCKHRDAKGRVCGAKTSLVHPVCERCLPYAYKVEIGPSRIRHSGLGLFAHDPEARSGDVLFEEGDVIAPYMGERLTDRLLKKRYFDAVPDPKVELVRIPYLMALEGGGYVDAALYRGPGAFANDARGTRFSNNVQFETKKDGTIDIVATTDIEQGDEIFVKYGDAYWKGFELRFETVQV